MLFGIGIPSRILDGVGILFQAVYCTIPDTFYLIITGKLKAPVVYDFFPCIGNGDCGIILFVPTAVNGHSGLKMWLGPRLYNL